MRVKVELAHDVIVFLEGLSEPDRDDFVAQLELVRTAPISQSDPTHELTAGRRDLRCFEFGVGVTKIAIFAYDKLEARIRVLKCRLKRPKEKRPPARGSP